MDKQTRGSVALPNAFQAVWEKLRGSLGQPRSCAKEAWPVWAICLPAWNF